MITTASPCIGICRLENDICVGCGRTKEEISLWSKFTANQKREINERLQILKPIT